MLTQSHHNDRLVAFSLQEVSLRSNLSIATLYRMIDRGELPTLKIGRRRLVPQSSLTELLTGAAA